MHKSDKSPWLDFSWDLWYVIRYLTAAAGEELSDQQFSALLWDAQ
jgi:hypothetical protein